MYRLMVGVTMGKTVVRSATGETYSRKLMRRRHALVRCPSLPWLVDNVEDFQSKIWSMRARLAYEPEVTLSE